MRQAAGVAHDELHPPGLTDDVLRDDPVLVEREPQDRPLGAEHVARRRSRRRASGEDGEAAARRTVERDIARGIVPYDLRRPWPAAF